MRFSFLITLAAAMLGAALPAGAANLVTYPFSGNFDPSVQGGVTASGFGDGGSKATVGLGNSDGNYAYILITKNSTNAGEAVSNAQYAQFSVSAPKNNGMQISQIQIIAARGGDSSPRGLVLRWSIDNYKSNLGQQDITTTWPTKKTYNFGVNAFIGTTVTFRLYAYAKEVNKVAPSVRIDNIVVTGAPIIYAPVVTPAATSIQTSKANYTIKGTAYSSVGLSRVEVSKAQSRNVYSGANGTTNWNYKATSLRYGTTSYYVRAVDSTGQVGPAVRVSIKRVRKNP